MTPPLADRPLCVHCQLRQVSKRAAKYCSQACSNAGKRYPRPICPVCQIRPVSSCATKTCGRSCAGIQRGESVSIARHSAAGVLGNKKAAARRLAILLRESFAPFADRVALELLMAVGAKLYRKGKYDGESLGYYRYVMAPRKHSA